MTAAEYKATREPLGTQTEVAAMLGVNRVTVAKRENGTMTLTNEAVLAIQSLRRPKRVRKSENGEITYLDGCKPATPSHQPQNYSLIGSGLWKSHHLPLPSESSMKPVLSRKIRRSTKHG